MLDRYIFMHCHYCNSDCIKKGFQKNGKQKYQCKCCSKYQQGQYINRAYYPGVTRMIATLLTESCGVRSISRVMNVTTNTVLDRIQKVANYIPKPRHIPMGKEYEVDEMRTYIGNKKRLYWVAYAMQKDNKKIIDYRVGKRNSVMLDGLIKTLLHAGPRRIYTDGLPIYKTLIPESIHRVIPYRINHIERNNLNLRTHLKRLTRKTICYSKTQRMLDACVRIYFWGNPREINTSYNKQLNFYPDKFP